MDIGKECWNLLWAVERSARYHARRQNFFDRWHKVTAAAGVIFGSTAAVNLLSHGDKALTLTAALVITVLSTVDLVVGTAAMARMHSDLKRRYLLLEGDISCADTPGKEDITRWRQERLRIEADEPPVYVALDLLCENEMARAKGRPQRAALGFWDIVTSHWLRHENIILRLADEKP
ncbi:hypothetical protein [Luteimonas sp. gir]|uniref:hypothetical protein n=1 Tax=Luteimonas sp. gir TaxID=3127960 RepID=UPI003075E6CA